MTDGQSLHHHRRSIRLQGWDYASDGAYFITICTRDRIHLFGNVVNAEMHLNRFGDVVSETWRWLATQYPYVALDEWCVMPNHLHGIVILRRGGSRTAPTSNPNIKPIGRLIGAFKTVSTKHINGSRRMPGAVVWQRDFWDHIIRDEEELERIREYIRANASNWASDRLNSTSMIS